VWCPGELLQTCFLSQRWLASKAGSKGGIPPERPATSPFAEETAAAEKETGRSIRRSLSKTGRFTRQPNNNPESQAALDKDGVGYSLTGLVAQMREQGNFWQQGDITVKLAKSYGYCWGVERAVRMAYEARRAFPGQKIYITNEIIHNPEVNKVRFW